MALSSKAKSFRPVMIAIGGDSGTGKTTFTRGVREIFGDDSVLDLCLDDYHTLDREGREREQWTPLNPIANNIPLMEEHILHLRAGQTVVKPVYNHATGTFDDPEIVTARPIVIVRGFFPLLTPRLRNAFDIKVWLEPEDDLKYHWKLQRDVAERGYLVEEVISSIVRCQDDVRKFIVPQIHHADIIVRFVAPSGYLKRRREGATDEQLDVQLIQRSANAVELASSLGKTDRHAGAFKEYRAPYRDSDSVVLEISGGIDDALLGRLEDRLWEDMQSHKELRRDKIGRFLENGTKAHSSHSLALSQLLLARRIVAVRDQLLSQSTLETIS